MISKRPSTPNVPPKVGTRVVELIARGGVVKAIAEVRAATGMEYKAAKAYVESMRIEWLGARVPVEAEEKTRELLREGRPKDAVKLVRKEAGLDRGEGKDFVQAVQDGWRRGEGTFGGDGGAPSADASGSGGSLGADDAFRGGDASAGGATPRGGGSLAGGGTSGGDAPGAGDTPTGGDASRAGGIFGGGDTLADRARAALHARGRATAVALVREETGMGIADAKRFVDRLA